MSRKHYAAMAKLILEFRGKLENGFPADERAEHVLDRNLIVPLAHMLREDNSAFDYTRFLRACGVEAS